MSGTHTIYTYPSNPRAYKGLIAAKYAGITVEQPTFTIGTDNKTPEFLEKFPCGKIPALDTPKGPIFESNAIAKYFARTGNVLLSDDLYESALIDQWIDFAASQIDPHVLAWLLPIFGIIPFDAKVTEAAKKDLAKSLDILNKHLLSHTFLVGESVTLADVIVSMSLLKPYTVLFDKTQRKPFPNVTRWFTTVVGQPIIKSVVGTVELCTEMQVAKPAPVVVKETPAPQKEEEPVKEEKKENPLDLLPPTKFSLLKFKEVYSNKDTRSEALPWLWENFDKEGFSFHLCVYKYADELAKSFFALNLIGGYFQRLERFAKYGFASFVVFGEDNNLQIGGVFLTRGTERPFELTEDGVADSFTYDWTQLNPDVAEDKKLIEDFFAWDGEFGGKFKAFNTGKVFK